MVSKLKRVQYRLVRVYTCQNAKLLEITCHGSYTRDDFYVRREVDLMKTAKVNAYIMHIFGKIELLSIYAT